jgi:hypothetical protein
MWHEMPVEDQQAYVVWQSKLTVEPLSAQDFVVTPS